MDIEEELTDLRAALRDPAIIAERNFEIASDLARVVSSGERESEARDLVIRALDKKNHFNGSAKILEALVREVGLFPYLDPSTLSVSDLIAYEFNRPVALPDDLVFHRVQTKILTEILSGRSVVLSAPTSFGKSLIVDAVIASGKYSNIVIVVPTIALIDETRRRLAKFANAFKIITHYSQAASEKNIFVLTQERVVERDDLSNIDFFVIDEFYKLDPHRRDTAEDRSYVLNHAFYKLSKIAKQFYMLGPSIRNIPVGFDEKFECLVIHTDFATVSSEIIRMPDGVDKHASLLDLCRSLDDPTLIYCKSPRSARTVAELLVEGGIAVEAENDLSEYADWVGEKYHQDWLFSRALRHGVGIHHGQIPRALAQLAVREFNNLNLRFLVCTSTLIEGVNTSARNVIIFDHLIARTKFDYFTFNNIKGRSGRMNRHFVGHVFLFHDEPQGELYEIDIPVFTQKEEIPESLLLQMEEADIDGRLSGRLDRLRTQGWLSYDTLRRNQHLDPESQIEFAQAIYANPRRYHKMLSWHGEPTGEQLRFLCEIVFDFFSPPKGYGVFSADQLTFKINQLRMSDSIDTIISEQVSSDFYAGRENPIEDAIDEALGFMRNWAGFHFPRFVGAVDNIQKDVFSRLSLEPGDFSQLIYQVENLYMPGAVVALDEYGLPIQIGRKIAATIEAEEGLDHALNRLRDLDVGGLSLTPVERRFVEWVRDGLSP